MNNIFVPVGCVFDFLKYLKEKNPSCGEYHWFGACPDAHVSNITLAEGKMAYSRITMLLRPGSKFFYNIIVKINFLFVLLISHMRACVRASVCVHACMHVCMYVCRYVGM